jgi:hypothetical protein
MFESSSILETLKGLRIDQHKAFYRCRDSELLFGQGELTIYLRKKKGKVVRLDELLADHLSEMTNYAPTERV